jgi:hypothetical protein
VAAVGVDVGWIDKVKRLRAVVTLDDVLAVLALDDDVREPPFGMSGRIWGSMVCLPP